MADPHPLNAHVGSGKNQTKSDKRRTNRLSDCLNKPTEGKSALGADSAWALKLKDAVDSAVRELQVEVLSAKPVLGHSKDPHEMTFELDTNKGRLKAVRLRGGKHDFHWVT